MKGIVIAGAVLALAGAAQAANWQTTATLGFAGTAVDFDQLTRNGDHATVWVLRLTNAQLKSSTDDEYLIAKEEYDCSAQAYDLAYMVSYSSSDKMTSSYAPSVPKQQVVPGAVEAGVYKIACQNERDTVPLKGDAPFVVRFLRAEFNKDSFWFKP